MLCSLFPNLLISEMMVPINELKCMYDVNCEVKSKSFQTLAGNIFKMVVPSIMSLLEILIWSFPSLRHRNRLYWNYNDIITL